MRIPLATVRLIRSLQSKRVLLIDALKAELASIEACADEKQALALWELVRLRTELQSSYYEEALEHGSHIVIEEGGIAWTTIADHELRFAPGESWTDPDFPDYRFTSIAEAVEAIFDDDGPPSANGAIRN